MQLTCGQPRRQVRHNHVRYRTAEATTSISLPFSKSSRLSAALRNVVVEAQGCLRFRQTRGFLRPDFNLDDYTLLLGSAMANTASSWLVSAAYNQTSASRALLVVVWARRRDSIPDSHHPDADTSSRSLASPLLTTVPMHRPFSFSPCAAAPRPRLSFLPWVGGAAAELYPELSSMYNPHTTPTSIQSDVLASPSLSSCFRSASGRRLR